MESLDEIFDLFGKERRRFALYYLSEADGKVPIEELSEQIDRWEDDPDATDFPKGEYDQMLISLEHDHLPKIDDATHVQYDRENDQLRITGMSSEIEVLLSVSKAIEQPTESRDIVLDDDHL